MSINWCGVFPAITTPFTPELEIDHSFLGNHAAWLIDEGCVGIIPGGSLGEAATLSHSEKLAVIDTVTRALDGRAPVIPGVASLSTKEAIRFVQDAEAVGVSGFMLLPPYAYSTDWYEMKAHMAAVMTATELPIMLYNNPAAYRTDFTPEQIAELAHEHENLEAVKESSTDVRRVSAIRALLGNRLQILVGVDDAIVEGLNAGAVGWVAGLANALAAESVELFRYASMGRTQEACDLYYWFLPLLRLDTVPKFVQLIKLVQASVGKGNARVRPPRLELYGEELSQAISIIETSLATRLTLKVRA